MFKSINLATVELLPKKSLYYRLYRIAFANGETWTGRVIRAYYQLGDFALITDSE